MELPDPSTRTARVDGVHTTECRLRSIPPSTARRPWPTGTRCCTWAGPTSSRRTSGSTGSGASGRTHSAARRRRQGRSATGGAEHPDRVDQADGQGRVRGTRAGRRPPANAVLDAALSVTCGYDAGSSEDDTSSGQPESFDALGAMIEALPANNEIVVKASDAAGNAIQAGAHRLRGERVGVPQHGREEVLL